jgi:hypothetical protein
LDSTGGRPIEKNANGRSDMIGLLKYLKKRYIFDLQVSDEGEYWETGDIRILKKKMNLIDEKLDQIANDLSSNRFCDLAGLSAEEIASRIEHTPPHFISQFKPASYFVKSHRKQEYSDKIR